MRIIGKQAFFPARVAAPKHKYDGPCGVVVYPGNYSVGKNLPPYVAVGIAHASHYREGGVEQKHPLLCPDGEVAALYRGVPARLFLDFPENIEQARRRRHGIGHTECKPHRLSRIYVRVLPQNNDLYVLRRGKVKSVEYKLFGGINRLLRIFTFKKRLYSLEIVLGKLLRKQRLPAVVAP